MSEKIELDSVLTDEVEAQIEDLTNADSRAVAEKIANILDKKKAGDIKILQVNQKTIIADYFVIASANSSTQVKSLSGEVEYKMSLCGLNPTHTDGMNSNDWAALDFSSVIVHIFIKSAREFYKLDKLWEDTTDVTEENEER